MKLEAQGLVIHEAEEIVSAARLAQLAAALGTESGPQTARLVPYFGPTVAGEESFVQALGLDLARALLGGIKYEWERPFEEGESITAKLFVDRVFDKGPNRFGVVVAQFTDKAGQLIARQSATFIEKQEA